MAMHNCFPEPAPRHLLALALTLCLCAPSWAKDDAHPGKRDGQMGLLGPQEPSAVERPAGPPPLASSSYATSSSVSSVHEAGEAERQATSASAASRQPSAAEEEAGRLQEQCAEMLKIWREKKKKTQLTDGEKADLRHFDELYRARCM